MSQPARKTRWDDSYNRYLNNGDFMHSSAAPALEPRRKAPSQPVPKSKQLTKKRGTPKVSPYDIAISHRRSRPLRLAALAVVFLGAFLCVFSMAYIESRNLALNGLQSELNQMKIDNIVLQGEVLDNYDLAEVERYAVDVLGMIKPLESQIVYVDAVNVSYTESYDTDKVSDNPLDAVLEMLKGLIWTE